MENRRHPLLVTCHPWNRESIEQRAALTNQGEGPTLFDEIIRDHAPGGGSGGSSLLESA